MRVVVVGDTLLDQDYDGVSTRLSPDAAVPVVEISQRVRRAGGAGLVATMLARDGHDVALVTVLSDDEASAQLRAALRGIEIVAGSSDAPTPVKTRVRCNGEPFGRLDEGCQEPPDPRVDDRMLAAIATADVLIGADYGRGLLADPQLRRHLERRGAEVPLVWDPHPRGAAPVAASVLVTPNRSEAATFAEVSDEEDPAQTAATLRDRWGCGAVAITLGEEGTVLHDGSASWISARPVALADPCGAGDRFAAAVAVSLASTGDLRGAVRAGVDAASAYLADGGVAAIAAAARQDEPVGRSVDAIVDAVRSRGGTVVATGGCFDLLHAGHVRTLQAARSLGDCLIVCINSDASVRRLKGASRPIIGEHDRAELLAALSCVDAVVVFGEDTPEALLAQLRPDVWVKGGDYSADALPESRLLAQWGGRTVTLPYHLGRSTTALASALAAVV